MGDQIESSNNTLNQILWIGLIALILFIIQVVVGKEGYDTYKEVEWQENATKEQKIRKRQRDQIESLERK